MSETTEVIDNLTGELEHFREMHAETLIEHAKERDRWAAQLRIARVLLTKLESAHRRQADGVDDMSEVSDVIDNLTAELRLAESARDYNGDMLDRSRVLLTKLEAHIRDAREMFHVLRNDKGRDDQGLDMKHIDTWLRAVHKTLHPTSMGDV